MNSLLNAPEVLRQLQAKGWQGQSLADRGDMGETALMSALQHKQGSKTAASHDELVAFLIENGADVQALDAEGCTALWYCDDFQKWAPVLVNLGVDINHLNQRGTTALLTDLDQMRFDGEDIPDLIEKIKLSFLLGLDPFQRVRDQPLLNHFLEHGYQEEFRDVFKNGITEEQREYLQKTLPQAEGVVTPSALKPRI